MPRLAVCLLFFAVAAASDLANSTTTPSTLGNASDLENSTTTPSPLANACDLAKLATTPPPLSISPCSLPPAESPGGLLVSNKSLPGELAALLPGTEMLQDMKGLAARLGERGEAPFALVGAAVSADVNASDVAAVRCYVERGGLLVVMGGTNTSRLLNAIFGWELTTYRPDVWWRAFAGVVSGSCFDMEETPVLNPKEQPQWLQPTRISSLPAKAYSVYSSASDSHVAVAEVGNGRVVWFAADWGGVRYNQALLAALRMGSGVHAPRSEPEMCYINAPCVSLRAEDLVFEGLHLVSLGATVRAKPGCL